MISSPSTLGLEGRCADRTGNAKRLTTTIIASGSVGLKTGPILHRAHRGEPLGFFLAGIRQGPSFSERVRLAFHQPLARG